MSLEDDAGGACFSMSMFEDISQTQSCLTQA